jgi:hypothetical protein
MVFYFFSTLFWIFLFRLFFFFFLKVIGILAKLCSQPTNQPNSVYLFSSIFSVPTMFWVLRDTLVSKAKSTLLWNLVWQFKLVFCFIECPQSWGEQTFFFFEGTGIWAKGLILARQVGVPSLEPHPQRNIFSLRRRCGINSFL